MNDFEFKPRYIEYTIQCVSLHFAISFTVYPDIKATEVTFAAWKPYLCSFSYVGTMKRNWGNTKKPTVRSILKSSNKLEI